MPIIRQPKVTYCKGKNSGCYDYSKHFQPKLTFYHVAPEDPSRWVNTTVTLYVDKGSVFATIQQVLTVFIGQNQQRQALTSITLKIASLIETKQVSAFEFMVPDMFTLLQSSS